MPICLCANHILLHNTLIFTKKRDACFVSDHILLVLMRLSACNH